MSSDSEEFLQQNVDTDVFLPNGFLGNSLNGSAVSGFRTFTGNFATSEKSEIVSSDAFARLLQPPLGPLGPGVSLEFNPSYFSTEKPPMGTSFNTMPKSVYPVPTSLVETSTEFLPPQMTLNTPLQVIQPTHSVPVCSETDVVLIPVIRSLTPTEETPLVISEETVPEPDEAVSSPDSFVNHETDGSPTKIRFNISWDSPDVATLCGTSIKFALKNGILELMTPINIPRLRKDEPFPSSGDETIQPCEVCSAVAPTMEDFFRWRHHSACSPDCLVWTNPYSHTGKQKSSFRNDKRELQSRGRKQLNRTAIPHQTGKLFNWPNYFADLQCNPADVCAFQSSAPQAFKFGLHNFTVGMRVEAVDPLHPYLYCLVEIVDCKAFRLRLHFIGYPDAYDFWVSQDSHFIFPPGWCFHNRKKLSPPKRDGMLIEGDEWQGMLAELASSYYKTKKIFKNSLDLISDESSSVGLTGGLTGGHFFRIGQKLEAVDKSHPGFICVATVRDILFSRVLVHFDGWSDEYDYWTEPWSSLIFPVGHCEKNGISINVPKGYNPAKFTWPRYLEETNSVAVPVHCFVKRTPPRELFKVNDRLEVVDPFCPRLIRVAHVLGVEDHHLRLSFDGWSTFFNEFTEDLDSSNIFPPRYCELSEHPIVLPPGYFPATDFQYAEEVRNTNCSLKLCGGYGHLDPSQSYHNRLADCPYRKIPLAKRLPDRITGVASPFAEEEKKSGCTNAGCDGKGHLSGRFATHLTTSGCPKNRKRKKRKFSFSQNFDNFSSGEENASVDSPGSAKLAPSSPENSNWPAQSSRIISRRTKKFRNFCPKNEEKKNFSEEKSFFSEKRNPFFSVDWENASPSLRSEISQMAKEIHSEICQRHLPPNPSMLRESRIQDFRKPASDFRKPFFDTSLSFHSVSDFRKPLFDTSMSVHTVSDVTSAFGIDVETLPSMNCQQAQAMAVKLFGPDCEVAKMFEREQIDGAGLVLLNLEGFVKFLKMPLGSAVTLDGIVKLAREKCNLNF